LIRFRGHRILAFGSMNFIQREIYDYTDRLMRGLNFPRLVLPTHWDNFLAPYDTSQQPSIDALQSFIAEVHAASPDSKVVVPP
jgi:hypothetical protein